MARQEFGVLRTRSLSGVVNDFGLGTENQQTQTISSIQEIKKTVDTTLKEQSVASVAPVKQEENNSIQETTNDKKRITHRILKILKGVQKVTTSLLALIGVTAITITLDEHMRAIGVDAETSNIIGVSTVAIAYIMGLSPFIRTLYKEAVSTTTAPQEDTSQQEVKNEEKSNDKEALRMGWFR